MLANHEFSLGVERSGLTLRGPHVRGSFPDLLWGLRNRAGAGIDTRRLLLPDDNNVKNWWLELAVARG
jgi:hypothetical protein